MSSIDERIVEMKFNNAQFERGVKQTQTSLETLKKGLNLDGAKKSLEGLSVAGRNFSLAGIADGVQTIASKFSALGIIGITVLASIASHAVSAGAQMLKSLSIAPIMSGFQEYELKMGSIQTILSNTSKAGTTLKEVTAALDELNGYADKTIYNFGDMTKNIGLFTNAGIGIKDATSMIKGFSNEAAASGTNAQGAASAAYQLSQALSAGKITLMDWRSLQNVGMGNANMKSGILEIADALGTLEDKEITAKEIQKDFNGSLEKGWLTADVMSTYLRIMAGDMDAATMKSIGLTDAQIKGFAKQQKIAEEAATKVRTLTQLMGTIKESIGSSWSETFTLLLGDFDAATELFTGINDALGTMIGKSSEARNKLISEFVTLGGRDAAIDAIKYAFQALLDIMKPVGEAWNDVFPAASSWRLVTIVTTIRDFFRSIKMGEKDLASIKTIATAFFATLDIGWQILKGALGLVGRVIGALWTLVSPLLEIAAALMAPRVAADEFLKSGDKIGKVFIWIGDVLLKPIELLQKFVNWIKTVVEDMQEINFLGISSDAEDLGKALTPLENIGEGIKAVWEKVVEIFGEVQRFFKPMTDAIGQMLEDMGPGIKKALKNLTLDDVIKVINTGLFGTLVVGITKFLGKFSGATKSGMGIIETIKEVFSGLTTTLKAMQDNLRSKTLLAIAGALALLTVSVIALSMVDSEALARALGAMAFMFVQLGVALAVFEKIANKPGIAKLPIVAASLVLMSIAINILASAVAKLSALDWNELAKGTAGITVLLAAMAGFTQIVKITPGMIASTTALILLSVAIKLLVSAVTDLAGLSWEELAKGIGGVTILLFALDKFTKALKNPAGIVGTAVAIAILGGALKLMASAVGDFGGLALNEIIKGIIGIGGALIVIGKGMSMMPKGPQMIMSAGALVIVSFALGLLADALTKMSGLSWDDIGRVAVVLAGSLLIIAGAMYLMSGALPGAAALVVVAYSLTMMATAFNEMAEMSWDDIGRVAVILAGSLLIIAGAMYIMTGALPGAAALIVVAYALEIIAPVLLLLGGMSWDAIGKGLTVLGGSLAILAIGGLLLTPVVGTFIALGVAAGLIGVGALAAGLGITMFAAGLTALAIAGAAGAGAITIFGMAIINLIPMAMTALANGIIAMAGVISGAGPQMVQAMTVFIMSILTTINILAPQIVNTLWNLVLLMANTLANNVPKLVDAGLKLLTGILTGIGNNIGKIVDAATRIIVNFLNGIARNIPKVINSAINLIISFVNGLADGIRRNQAKMEKAGKNLAGAIIDGVVGGLGNGLKTVINAAKKIAEGALNAAKNFLGIKSPSREFFKVGGFSVQGMANGLVRYGYLAVNAAKGVAKSTLVTLKSAMSRVGEALSGNIDMTPVIRPVLDLTDIKNKADELTGILDPNGIALEAANVNASNIAASRRAGADAPVTESSESASEPEAPIIYNQYNNSPKALSAADVYRGTKNQLSKKKEELTPSA